MMTNFKKVCRFNFLVGDERSQRGMESQIKMLKEEFEELCAGVHAQDMNEIRDGIADCLYVLYGLAYKAGIDADADFEVVHANNMTKFVLGARENVTPVASEVGLRLGILVNIKEVEPLVWSITSAYNQTGNDGKKYPAGKLLKPTGFIPVEFK